MKKGLKITVIIFSVFIVVLVLAGGLFSQYSLMMPRPHPESKENQPKVFAQSQGPTSQVVSQQGQERLVEEVSVNWWQVPVFAVDKAGNPVTDLEAGDIEVRLNGRSVPGFILNKRDFSVTEIKAGAAAETPAPAQPPPVLNGKVVFLLFDLALSGTFHTTQAKKIAQEIIKDTKEDTYFIIMVIDTFAGLLYVGEGSGSNKPELINQLEQKVNKRKADRVVDVASFKNIDIPGMFEEEDMPFFEGEVSNYYTRRNMGFFSSFATLYLYLNSIEGTKFIYLFSEGISASIMDSGYSLGKTRGTNLYYLKQVAEYLNRCGGALFIINSREERLSPSSLLSGENSLLFLARESGGTYLDGTRAEVVKQLENLHRAYYEVSFPDDPQLQGTSRKIAISSKRKGITIHSLHTLEKRKDFAAMNKVEKELLVLNLVTQPPHSLLKNKISAYNTRVDNTRKNKTKVNYSVTLPPSYLGKTIDLYKVYLIAGNQGVSQVSKIEKESLKPQKNKLNIEFNLTEPQDKTQKAREKETAKGEIKTYFVLIDEALDPARASVYGMELYEDDPELPAPEEAAAVRKSGSRQAITPEEMKEILQGAADYCERLKQSAFHFYCREKILETRQPLTAGEKDLPEISYRSMRAGTIRTMDEIREKVYTRINYYNFGYRLIKQGNKIEEERDYISSKDNVKVNRDQVIKANAFFSEKAIFAPITLLDRSRQDKYDYRFIHDDERHGRRAAVIAAVPKDPVETASIYGKIWIDREDFSVLKIEADPASIRGYKALKELSKKLRTKLYLSLETEFNQIREGIRFPTKVSMLEKYKGGRIISDFRGPQGWERTRTEFTYNDYQFFNVQTDVTVH